MRRSIQYSYFCERGSFREVNQDSVFADTDGRYGIFCVADGMGGHENGEIASRIVTRNVEVFWKQFKDGKMRECFETAISALETAVAEANREIYFKYNQSSVCGSTVVILFIFKRRYVVISAGDSRVYICKRKELNQITIDDVWENGPEQCAIPTDELKHSPKFGKLTNAVGTRETIEVSRQTHYLSGGTVFLLCSDGVHKYCPINVLSRIMNESKGNTSESAERLKNIVYEHGAKDNLSAVIVNTGWILL